MVGSAAVGPNTAVFGSDGGRDAGTLLAGIVRPISMVCDAAARPPLAVVTQTCGVSLRLWVGCGLAPRAGPGVRLARLSACVSSRLQPDCGAGTGEAPNNAFRTLSPFTGDGQGRSYWQGWL